MKKLFIIYIFLISNYYLLIDDLGAQWQQDIRLTNTSGRSLTSFNNCYNIASNGNILHIVWTEEISGNFLIYYKRSNDGGANWEANIPLTSDTASIFPSISTEGSVVHVVWVDSRDGNEEIYYKRSTDDGLNWGPKIRLTNSNGVSEYPSVTVSGLNLFVVWTDFRNGNGEIYYKRSTDGGTNWESDVRLTNDTAVSGFPSLSISNSVIHLVWEDKRSGVYGIYYKQSTDGGISWTSDSRISNGSRNSRFPSIAVLDSIVHIVWEDLFSIAEIYYIRSSNGGVTFGNNTQLINAISFSDTPVLLISGSFVNLVWFDGRDGGNGEAEIYYKRSIDKGITWGSDTRLTNHAGFSYFPSITASGQILHVVWMDNRDGNDEIYYKRNPTGNIGIINNSLQMPNTFSLSQNYPNPFNPTTNIKLNIPKKSIVKLVIYNSLGKEVATLVNEELNSGSYQADWDASEFSSGVYFYRIETEYFVQTRSMVLLK